MTRLTTLRLDKFNRVYKAVNGLNRTDRDYFMGAGLSRYREKVASAQFTQFDWAEFAWGTECYEDNRQNMYVNPTELGWDISLVPDVNQYKNSDLPDNLSFKDMGLVDRENRHLDYQKMNDRDFRERCVQMNGRNYALYMKGRQDAGLKPANHKDQQVIQGIFEEMGITCSNQTADDLAIMARKFGLDRRSMMRLIHGYIDQAEVEDIRNSRFAEFDEENKLYSTSLTEFNKLVDLCDQFCKSLASELVEFAVKGGLKTLDYIDLETTADSLKDMSCRVPSIPAIGDPFPRKLDDEREFYHDVYQRLIDSGQRPDDPFVMMEFIELNACEAFYNPDNEPHELDESMMIQYGFDPEEIELKYERLDSDDDVLTEETDELTPASKYEDMEYDQVDGNVFSAFPLFHGEDNLNYEFIAEIKTADHKTLKEIQNMAFDQQDHYSGRTKKSELRHLTPAQLSQFWNYINDRKAKLGREGLKNLSHNSRVVLGLMRKMGPFQSTKAMLKSYEHQSDFETDFEYLEFSKMKSEPSSEDMFTLWAQFRLLEASSN